MHKNRGKFIMKKFPQGHYYTEELCDWVFDYLLPLDSFLGSLIITYNKGLNIKNSDMSVLKKDLIEARSKLNKMRNVLDNRDLVGYAYTIEYVNAMLEAANKLSLEIEDLKYKNN